MKKKEKLKTLVCSCCGEKRTSVKMQTILKHGAFRSKLSEAQRLEVLEAGTIKWACDTCLVSRQAVVTKRNDDAMEKVDIGLAYFDTQLKCYSCCEIFVFSKEEQVFWFEEMRFPSPPSECLSCRQNKRTMKAKNKSELTELSQILADKDNLNVSDMKRVVELYNLLGMSEKAKFYQAKLSKLKP